MNRTRQSRATALLLLALVVGAGGCAARRFDVPAGPRAPAPGAAAAWADMTAGCGSVRWYSSALRLSGRVEGQGLPGGLLIFNGFDEAGRLRLEGHVAGRLVFTLAGSSERATLVLHREREFTSGSASAILGELVGLDMTPARLLGILTGCATADERLVEAARVGDLFEIVTADARVFLEAGDGGWRPRVALTEDLQVDYRRFEGGWPSDIAIWSRAAAGSQAELRLRVDSGSVVINDALPAEAFAVNPPPDAVPVSLAELRDRLGRTRR